MPLLRVLRYWQHRHVSFVRCAMLLVLLSVAASGMPRWIVHAHTADHATALVMSVDGHGLDGPDVGASEPADSTVDGAHLHGHYIAALPALLPSILVGALGDAPPAGSCPLGPVTPPCEGHLATLYRPPIV